MTPLNKISDFNYSLPPKLISQKPLKKRDSCRLLVLEKKTGKTSHQQFSEIINFLQAGDVLVFNNSKVIPARLFGNKKTSGGRLELLLIKNQGDYWEVLVGGKVRVGTEIIFPDCDLSALVVSSLSPALWGIKFNFAGKKLFSLIKKIGQVPLPPYIKRAQGPDKNDFNYYQTVYASDKKMGSVAAPTAGLHFTSALLKKIEKKGVILAPITLHVGLGTFAPLKVEKVKDVKLHKEWVEVSKESLEKIKTAKRVIAVGTTTVRALESVAQKIITPNQAGDYLGETAIFISPGYKFKVVDSLITNFHLPQSSLLMLVSALAGKEKTFLAYREAIDQEYLFFSYGDAMLII